MKKIFYYTDYLFQTSIIAGYIHLQKLPNNRIPSISEILSLLEISRMDSVNIGIPYFLGKDQSDREIFWINFGSPKLHKLAIQTLQFLFENQDKSPECFFLKIPMKLAFFVRFCRFITKHFKLLRFHRLINAYVIQKNYRQLLNIVESKKGLIKIG